MRQKDEWNEERDKAVERLRDFLKVNYVPATEVARSLKVRPETIYAWLSGESRPARPERIVAFLESLPRESGSGVAPTGYEYRQYKNWRGIPKPRRCPFCKNAKGQVRKVRGGFQGVCPNCGATGPKKDGYDRALLAWNGKDSR